MAKTPLHLDYLLSEIFLRLPPQPSSLPRVSLVCKRWRRLVSDPQFCRRFRLHHRRNPPLLGFFDGSMSLSFIPTLRAPNRVPQLRFSLQCDSHVRSPLGCRHGLFLILLPKLVQVLVWDPVTGDKHHFALPPEFHTDDADVKGAVLRADGDDDHNFHVVLAATDVDQEQREQLLARVYSSKNGGSWSNLISTPLPHQVSEIPTIISDDDAVMARSSIYWKLSGKNAGILEFNLESQSLAVIHVPSDMNVQVGDWLKIIRSDSGGLGLLFIPLLNCTAQLWKRTNCDGIFSWELTRTIELGKLLSLPEKTTLYILGFAEENNVVFLSTAIGIFMINLGSLKFNKLLEMNNNMIYLSHFYPFESVYAAGTIPRVKLEGSQGRHFLIRGPSNHACGSTRWLRFPWP